MSRKNLYIVKYYLKYFSIILFGLSLFFVAIDFMQNSRDIPSSTNLQILYFYYKTLYAISILFPISLVFGAILTFIQFLKSNSLIALYSVGYSDRDVLSPIFTTSLFATLLFILLYTTQFANSKQLSEDILEGNPIIRNSQNLFFKYETRGKIYYVFFEKLYPIQSLAEGIRLFEIGRDNELVEMVKAKYGYYDGKRWIIYSAKFLKQSNRVELNHKIIKEIDQNRFAVLEGFKPKILDKIYDNEMEFNLIELMEAIKLMRSQGLSIEKLKVALYGIVIYPLFAPLLIVVIFKYIPISSRFSDINFFAFVAIVASLLIWGLLFALLRLSLTGNLVAELSVVVPILILAIVALFSL